MCVILCPLQDSSMGDDGYAEPMDTQPGSMAPGESSKLPPVLANLMGNLNNSSRSPQTNPVSSPVAPTVNVQELLTSIMVRTVRRSFHILFYNHDHGFLF